MCIERVKLEKNVAYNTYIRVWAALIVLTVSLLLLSIIIIIMLCSYTLDTIDTENNAMKIIT